MKVAVYYNNHDVRIEERQAPDPGPGEILVKTKACGVCVADTMEWYLTPRAPLSLGHEPTGVIAKAGPNTPIFKEGDRVAIHHHVLCLVCEYCRRGNFTMCETFKKTHIKPGGFADYFLASALHVERDTHLLPEHLSFEVGTLMEPLACVIHAIRQGQALRGKPYRVFSSDVRVFVRETGLATYPDLSVVCGSLETAEEDQDAIVNPVLLAEVLSPSNEAWDRGGKAAHYRRIPSLRALHAAA